MKSIVLIDGGNFYHKLLSLGVAHTVFDFKAFSAWLAGRSKSSCTYYVGAIRKEHGNPKSEQLFAKQQAFLANLASQYVTVELGYILRGASGYHEKGVDVKMATDLLVGAFQNRYDRAYLVSSDTDLIPAIQWAKDSGKHIAYVGFAHQPSYGLLRTASSSRLLSPTELVPFLSQS